MRYRTSFFAIGLLIVAPTSAARADLVISNEATQNMSCDAGVCTATAKKATLNSGDLTQMLASADTTVKTGGGAKNIDVLAALSWTSTNRLTLDAELSITFTKTVKVAGQGALIVTTNDGGSGGDFQFLGKGHIEFWDLSSSLIINGNSYTLVGDVATLASDIKGQSSGFFALARTYDASIDGTYGSAPIATAFGGQFEGLGNNISHLSIDDEKDQASIGLFAVIAASALLRDIGVTHLSFKAGYEPTMGGLVGQSLGTIVHSYATGLIEAGDSDFGLGNVGGLVGYSTGSIENSYAAVSLKAGALELVGGLAAENSGTISDSYATGSVKGGGRSVVGGLIGTPHASSIITGCHATGKVASGRETVAGGLVGINYGTISQSFATGSVAAGRGSTSGGFAGALVSGSVFESYARGDSSVESGDTNFKSGVGGFAGYNASQVSQSYSTGMPSAGKRSVSGGFFGADKSSRGSIADAYWDTTTSGTNVGVGNRNRDPGITGLTTQQFQSGLPAGFSPTVWKEKSKINNGFPYLIDNSPPQ